MTHKEILNYCLDKKGAYQDNPFGDETVCVKVKKRIFAQLFCLKDVPMFTFNGDALTSLILCSFKGFLRKPALLCRTGN